MKHQDGCQCHGCMAKRRDDGNLDEKVGSQHEAAEEVCKLMRCPAVAPKQSDLPRVRGQNNSQARSVGGRCSTGHREQSTMSSSNRLSAKATHEEFIDQTKQITRLEKENTALKEALEEIEAINMAIKAIAG